MQAGVLQSLKRDGVEVRPVVLDAIDFTTPPGKDNTYLRGKDDPPGAALDITHDGGALQEVSITMSVPYL